MARIVETFIVGGRPLMRRAGTGEPFRDVGLVSSYQQAHQTTDITLPNTRTPSGGTFDKVTRITGMTLAINFREFNSGNLAALLWADVNAVPSTAVSDETHIALLDREIVLDRMPKTITSVTDTQVTPVTYVEDTDFRLTNSGIEVLPGSALATAITAAAGDFSLKVSYTCADFDEIEALVNSGQEFEIFFEGVNGAGTQGRINCRYWRVKFAPAATLDWLNTQDFMGMDAACEVLADTTRGAGKSQYMKIQKEKPAAV